MLGDRYRMLLNCARPEMIHKIFLQGTSINDLYMIYIIIFSHVITYLQGQPRLSEQSKLALTERNLHAKIILKVVLKSWDYDIFGTTACFYEMHTLRPLLSQMSTTLGFKKNLGFFLNFAYFSFDSESLWHKICWLWKIAWWHDALFLKYLDSFCFIFEDNC